MTNTYVYAALSVFIVLYAGLAVPKLPSSISSFLRQDLVRMAILAGIAYISTQDVNTAVLIGVGYMVALTMLAQKELYEGFRRGDQPAPSEGAGFAQRLRNKLSKPMVETMDTIKRVRFNL